jgi:NitT/TauT family transport system substrate-binding protein
MRRACAVFIGMMLAYFFREFASRRQLPAIDDNSGDRRPQAKGRAMMRMMRAWTRAAIVGSALAVAGPAASAEKIVFQFGWLPGGDRAAYYLASHVGLFAAEGLEVQLLPGKGSTDALTKIATGVADMGEGGLDALLTAKVQNEVPVTAVMAIYTKAPDALVTTTASGIKTLRDVTGKTVATSPFTSSNGPWPFLLRMNGVDPATVNLIKADPGALGPMLATGRVDAVIQYVTNAPATATILQEVKKTIHMIPWADYGLTGYSSSVFVSHKMLATRRDTVVRFTRALKKAEQMMREDPDKAATALKAIVPEVDVSIAKALVLSTLPLIFNENTQRDGLGVFSPDIVKTTWEWVAKQQDVSLDKLDPMSSVDLRIATVQ